MRHSARLMRAKEAATLDFWQRSMSSWLEVATKVPPSTQWPTRQSSPPLMGRKMYRPLMLAQPVHSPR